MRLYKTLYPQYTRKRLPFERAAVFIAMKARLLTLAFQTMSIRDFFNHTYSIHILYILCIRMKIQVFPHIPDMFLRLLPFRLE